MDTQERFEAYEERRAIRAELDRLTLEQIKKLQEELNSVKEQLTDVLLWKEKHVEQYVLDQPTLSILRHVAGFSVVLRWIVFGALGVLTAIGATQLAFETIQKWMAK